MIGRRYARMCLEADCDEDREKRYDKIIKLVRIFFLLFGILSIIQAAAYYFYISNLLTVEESGSAQYNSSATDITLL